MYSERVYSQEMTFSANSKERLREIARFVLTATRFLCNVKVEFEGQGADGKSIAALAGLPMVGPSRVLVQAWGPEAEPCLKGLAQAALEEVQETADRESAGTTRSSI
jgi:phosphotransferase system HPr-like phosphotransfer protein